MRPDDSRRLIRHYQNEAIMWTPNGNFLITCANMSGLSLVNLGSFWHEDSQRIAEVGSPCSQNSYSS